VLKAFIPFRIYEGTPTKCAPCSTVQVVGVVHLQAAERVLQYVRGAYDQGIRITYCDLGAAVKNKLIGWVDCEFGSDPDTRKSMTAYLMTLNGDAISWRSSRPGGVTLSSSEAEFVACMAASQAGQEVVYLRELLKGFGHPQKKPTEIWEDKASCIMMLPIVIDRDISMSRYTISVTWFVMVYLSNVQVLRMFRTL
jgi:hypothetical protein